MAFLHSAMDHLDTLRVVLRGYGSCVVAYSGGRWIESSDTRLLPNQSATLSVPWKGYDRVRFWLEVHPDDYYDRRIYDSLLASFDQAGPATTLIAEADALAAKSSFRLFEMELTPPR